MLQYYFVFFLFASFILRSLPVIDEHFELVDIKPA